VLSQPSFPTALNELLTQRRDALLKRWAALSGRFALRSVGTEVLAELEHALFRGTSQARLRKLVAKIDAAAEAPRELTLLRQALLEVMREHGIELGQAESALLHRAIDDILLAFTERTSEQRVEEFELRERFVRVLGHDLRNPISAIKLGSALLLRDTQPPEARQRTTERIVSSANRMLRVMEDLLDFMRLRPGGVPEVDLGTVSLNELCREVVEENLLAHPRRAIVFSADGQVNGRFDRRRLSHALSNVIASALDHSPAQSEVSVALQANGEACIRVWHEGPAISSTELEAIFDPLGHGEGSGGSERPARGLGLGLYMADQIVRAHGGRIVAESSGEAGTSFRLLLPSHPKH
jgi:signal transduction histidine kinase